MSNLIGYFEGLNCRCGESKRMKLRKGSEMKRSAALMVTSPK